MSTQILDPYEAATQAAESANTYFGKLETYARFTDGAGKNAPEWVEGMDISNRKTQLELRLNPIDAMNARYLVTKTMVAEFSDWQRTTWPSMRDLGCKTPKDVDGKWVQIKLVPGREYTNKTTGEKVQPTIMKFIAIYNSEAEATAAWENENSVTVEAHTPSSTPQPATNDAEKAAAAGFLPHLVKGAEGDLTKLATILASMTPVNKYFTVDSPEVVALLKAA